MAARAMIVSLLVAGVILNLMTILPARAWEASPPRGINPPCFDSADRYYTQEVYR
jgi:hypothetical protein